MLDIHISTAAQELNARLDKGWAELKNCSACKIPPFSFCFPHFFPSMLFPSSPSILLCSQFSVTFLGDLEGFEHFSFLSPHAQDPLAGYPRLVIMHSTNILLPRRTNKRFLIHSHATALFLALFS
jgi:hypothetical protein